MTIERGLLQRKDAHIQEEHWIPLSDLMTGLMMLFMLVAIIFMVQVQTDAKKIKSEAMAAEAQAKVAEVQANTSKAQADTVKSIALIYNQLRTQLYRDLYSEFKNDLPAWGAELYPDLTLRFKEPEVLFTTGLDVIKPRFASILNDFFPRYVKILNSKKYKDAIEEIRIEGHTSSIWKDAAEDRAYFANMLLSQSRTRSVLEYVLSLPEIAGQQSWLRGHLTANGLSSSKLIFHEGKEDIRASQRVEFRVRTNADDRIAEILKSVSK
jgi:outer membrane protein OmpA-like peptidoglycan-associated protein